MKSLKFLLSVIIILFSISGISQWTTDPENPGLVCDLAGFQNEVKSFSDDEGGAYVFWLDSRNNPGLQPKEIYGQHYDNQGYALWEAGGRMVMSHYNAIWEYDVKRNDNGTIMLGMITQSLGYGGGDTLRFQMLDELGESVWENPLVVANSAFLPNYILYLTSFILLPVGSEFYALIEVSYFGGANGNRFTRFGSNGDLLGVYDGIPVGNQSYIGRTECASSNDGTGDFFLYYATGNGSGADLHAWRFDNTGNAIWGPVNVVQGTGGLSYQFSGICDDYGITFVWQGSGTGSVDLFARRLTSGGAFAWEGNTINICTAAGSQDNFHMKRKDMYLYVAWADGRPGVDPGYSDIYAQKLDTMGYLYWSPDGIEIASFNTYFPYPMLEVMDDYSIIVNHQSSLAGFMAQKVDDDGSLPWGPGARQISTTSFNPFYQMHSIFQSGDNTIVVWNKALSGGGSDGVYITRIDAFTGVEESGIYPSFRIFPNPADDRMEVMAVKEFRAESVSLFSATGQHIETKKITLPGAEEKINFDVSGLPAGIYFVRLTGASIEQGQKIIIQ